jgi:hypothetical protein
VYFGEAFSVLLGMRLLEELTVEGAETPAMLASLVSEKKLSRKGKTDASLCVPFVEGFLGEGGCIFRYSSWKMRRVLSSSSSLMPGVTADTALKKLARFSRYLFASLVIPGISEKNFLRPSVVHCCGSAVPVTWS